MISHRNGLAALAAALTLGACNSGSGGASQPLSVPSQMTVVGAQDQQTGSLRLIPDRHTGQAARAAGGALATLTDYVTDETRLWVHDESLGPMQIINEILCMLDQTGYTDASVLNQGPYVVLVNATRCEARGSDPSNGGQTTTANVVEYEEWTVRSDRADGASPHVVSFWIDWEEEFGDGQPIAARLYGLLTIYQSPDDTAPYGRFTLHFKLLPRAAPPDSTAYLFRGTLSTVARDDGLAEYTFFNTMGDIDATPQPGQMAFRERARVVTDGTTGRAYTSTQQKWNQGSGPQEESAAFHLAYNAGYVARRKVAGSEEVKAFDRNAFDTYPWRYGLYDSTTEARVNRNAGFGVRSESGEYGHAGYHGLWFPDHVAVTSGMQVTRPRHDGGTGETYTVFVAPGRLEKRVRSASSLGNLRDEDLHTWDSTGNRPVLVRWTGSDLVAVSFFDEQSHQWQELNPPVSFLDRYQPGWWVGFYSPARGEINLTWPQGSPTDATPIAIWSIVPITADSPELASGDLALHGYFQMLRSNITQNQANWAGGESPYFPDATTPQEGKTYAFDKETLVLQLDGQNVTLLPGVTIEGRNGGGLHSGPMLTSPLGELGQMQDQGTTFQWMTGTQQWNQLRTLRDGTGAFVTFDPPLEFSYTHNEPGNQRFHGRTFRLQYEGHGQLHGIPYEEEAGTHRWYPVLAIPTGTLLSNEAGTFKTKILEAEQRMREVDVQLIQQQGLDLDNTLTPPADSWSEPGIGAKPAVDRAPAFIDGVRQQG